MLTIKHNNWNEVSIDLYNKIQELINGKEDEITKQVKLISLLTDTDEDTVWQTNMFELQELIDNITFINNIDFDKSFNKKKLQVGKFKCKVITDLNSFSYAQYVDFQNYFSDNSKISLLLSTILVPESNKYNDGYDIVELINEIEHNISIVEANSLMFFFLKSFVTSIRRTNLFLLGQTRMKMIMMSKKHKNYEQLKTILTNSKQIEHILSSVLSKK